MGLKELRDVQGIRWSLITHFKGTDKCIFEIFTDCSIFRFGGVETERKRNREGTDRVNLQIRD